jgi:hypothetical protein
MLSPLLFSPDIPSSSLSSRLHESSMLSPLLFSPHIPTVPSLQGRDRLLWLHELLPLLLPLLLIFVWPIFPLSPPTSLASEVFSPLGGSALPPLALFGCSHLRPTARPCFVGLRGSPPVRCLGAFIPITTFISDMSPPLQIRQVVHLMEHDMQPARMKLHAKGHTNNPVQRPNFRGHAAGDGEVTRACGSRQGNPYRRSSPRSPGAQELRSSLLIHHLHQSDHVAFADPAGCSA